MRTTAWRTLLLTGVAVLAWACGSEQPPVTAPTPVPTATPTPTPTNPGDTWASLAPLSAPRQEHSGALLGGKIYVVGGRLDGQTAYASGQVYDIASDRWSPLPDLPIQLDHSAAAVTGGKLYLFGGQSPQIDGGLSDRTYEFDPGTGLWRERARMSSPRSAAAADLIGDRIYVVGGSPGPVSTRIEAYAPQSDTWELLPSMPTRRNHLTAVAMQGLLYVAGGRDSDSVAALERYDPVARTWTTLSPMPTARNSHMAAAVRGCLYVMGGETNPSDASGVFANNEVYDPKTNTWQTVAAMRTPRHAARAVTDGNKIYVPGGATHSGYGATTVNEVYTVPSGKSCE